MSESSDVGRNLSGVCPGNLVLKYANHCKYSKIVE